jgi:hypothetical protein
LLGLSGSSRLLKKAESNIMSVDRFIRTEVCHIVHTP